MWGGIALLYFFSRISSIIRRQRRMRYVKQIKKFRFRSKKYVNSDGEPTCSICLCELEENEYVKKLRCKHVFHSDCIDPWLINEKAVCPVCRRGIYAQEDWNMLEEGQSNDIDVILNRVEQRTSNSFSNVFFIIFCIFIVGYPLTLVFFGS